jgi:hypothetical protein
VLAVRLWLFKSVFYSFLPIVKVFEFSLIRDIYFDVLYCGRRFTGLQMHPVHVLIGHKNVVSAFLARKITKFGRAVDFWFKFSFVFPVFFPGGAKQSLRL